MVINNDEQYRLLCEQVILFLGKGSPDKVLVSSTRNCWTRRELIDAIQAGHPEGKKFVNRLVVLALDLFLRGKEKMEGFEVAATI